MEVALESSAGEIVIEVFEKQAPRTAEYFLDLVDKGVYEGTSFYRSTTLGVPDGPGLIQGGVLADVLTHLGSGSPPRERPELLTEIETTAQTGLLHRAATLSLARDLLDTGFALPDFFICLGAFPQLDFGGRTEPDDQGFPAFGEVVAGMDVVARIAEQETRGATPLAMLEGQILTKPVVISRLFRR